MKPAGRNGARVKAERVPVKVELALPTQMTGNIRTNLIMAGPKLPAATDRVVQQTNPLATSSAVPACHVSSTVTADVSCVFPAMSNPPLTVNQRGCNLFKLDSTRADHNATMEVSWRALNDPEREVALLEARQNISVALFKSLRETQVAINNSIQQHKYFGQDKMLQQMQADLDNSLRQVEAGLNSLPSGNQKTNPVLGTIHSSSGLGGLNTPSTPMPRGVVSKLKRKPLFDSSPEFVTKCRRKSTLPPVGPPLPKSVVEMRVGLKINCSFGPVRDLGVSSKTIAAPRLALGPPSGYGTPKTTDEIEEWMSRIPDPPVRRKLF